MSRKRKKENFVAQFMFLAAAGAALWSYNNTGSLETGGKIIGVGLGLFLGVKLVIMSIRKNKLKMSGIDVIDKMDGLQFEEYLRLFFIENGYQAEVTKASGDYGADLILKKDGQKIVAQAKRYKEAVGIKAVQEIIGAKNYYNADKTMVVTNSRFTDVAKRLARVSNVELIDRERLIEMMSTFNKQGAQITPETVRETVSPTCPKCNAQLVVRNGRKGKFYGCANFPQCKHTAEI